MAGLVRPVTCGLAESGIRRGITRPTTAPIAIATTIPRNRNQSAPSNRFRYPAAIASAAPKIGVPSGAMIIAPTTVAVEFSMTPPAAMTVDSTSNGQKNDRFSRRSPSSRKSSSCTSSSERRWVEPDSTIR